jgi:hypothetical protein
MHDHRQIEAHGLLVKEGAIVVATIVESSRRPRKIIEVMLKTTVKKNHLLTFPQGVKTWENHPGRRGQ